MIDKSLILISDGDYLTSDAARLIKMVLGQDDIPFDIKFKTAKKASFKNDAVIFSTSNLQISNATVGLHNSALISRMFEIAFPHIPETPQAGLVPWLLKKSSTSLINWAFGVSKEALQIQVRIGLPYPFYKNFFNPKFEYKYVKIFFRTCFLI